MGGMCASAGDTWEEVQSRKGKQQGLSNKEVKEGARVWGRLPCLMASLNQVPRGEKLLTYCTRSVMPISHLHVLTTHFQLSVGRCGVREVKTCSHRGLL